MPLPLRMMLNPLFPAKLEHAFTETVREYADQAREAFDKSEWGWNKVTHRRNGDVVSSPRNIVDSGELRDSQQEPQIVGLTARITWDSDHAAPVFLGAVYHQRSCTLPARNLPLHTLQNMNFSEVFMRHFLL